MHPADLPGFEAVYRRHVDLVVQGDMAAVLADMEPASVPQVFAGVDTPRGGVQHADIRSIRFEDNRGVGEAVYSTGDRKIGLRSGWRHDGETWKADVLENFAVDGAP